MGQSRWEGPCPSQRLIDMVLRPSYRHSSDSQVFVGSRPSYIPGPGK